MIWAWIKSLFNPEPQKDPHLQLYEDPDYSTMSKGDLKKLLAQGKLNLFTNLGFNYIKTHMSFRLALLKALEDKYDAEISSADATIKIYLEKPVGIGEHPQHIEELDKLFQKIVDAEEKKKALMPFKF